MEEQITQVLKHWHTATETDLSMMSHVERPRKLPYLQELLQKYQLLDTKKQFSRPTCRPMNRQDYLERLNTFTIPKWFAKPNSIGPFTCARYGWINTDIDQLECQCCQAILCFKFDDRLSMEGIRQTALVYVKQLVTGHADFCAWKDNPSPFSFTTLPCASPEAIYSNFLERFQGLSILTPSTCPRIDPSFYQALEAQLKQPEQTWLMQVYQWVVSKSKLSVETQDTSPEALSRLGVIALALTGWSLDQLSCTSEEYFLGCKFCGRRAGLWSFQSCEQLTLSSAAGGPTPKKRRIMTRLKTKAKGEKNTPPKTNFNPIAQHRWYCPWQKQTEVEVESQTPDWIQDFHNLTGWKQCVQMEGYCRH